MCVVSLKAALTQIARFGLKVGLAMFEIIISIEVFLESTDFCQFFTLARHFNTMLQRSSALFRGFFSGLPERDCQFESVRCLFRLHMHLGGALFH